MGAQPPQDMDRAAQTNYVFVDPLEDFGFALNVSNFLLTSRLQLVGLGSCVWLTGHWEKYLGGCEMLSNIFCIRQCAVCFAGSLMWSHAAAVGGGGPRNNILP